VSLSGDHVGAQSQPVSWWATWRPFGLSCLLTVLLIPLVLHVAMGIYDTRAPFVVLFPFGALAAVAKTYVHIPPGFLMLGQLPLYALLVRAGARAGHLRSSIGAVALVHLLAVGLGSPISWGPSLEEFKAALREASGSRATDCGVIELNEPRAAAASCASDALAQGESFSVAFQVMGVDSTIYIGLAQRGGSVATRLVWDSDITGGYNLVPLRRIDREPCRVPSVQATHGTPPIACGLSAGGA